MIVERSVVHVDNGVLFRYIKDDETCDFQQNRRMHSNLSEKSSVHLHMQGSGDDSMGWTTYMLCILHSWAQFSTPQE